MASCEASPCRLWRSRPPPACSSPSARSASRTRSPMFPLAYVPLVIVAFLAPTTVGLLIAIHQPAQQDRVDSCSSARSRRRSSSRSRFCARPGLGARARPGASGRSSTRGRSPWRSSSRTASCSRPGGAGSPSAPHRQLRRRSSRSHALRPRCVLRRRRRGSESHGGQRGRGTVLGGRLRVVVAPRSCVGMLGSLVAGARRDPDPASTLGRDRAAADAVARLVGHARPGHASSSASPRGSSVWRLGVTIADCHRLPAPHR